MHTLTIADGVVTPDAVAVPKDARVRLVLHNTGAAPAVFAIAGYEATVAADTLAPGATHSVAFVADLPGEGFALLVDGRPAGRLAVTGSHLVEGHR